MRSRSAMELGKTEGNCGSAGDRGDRARRSAADGQLYVAAAVVVVVVVVGVSVGLHGEKGERSMGFSLLV